MPGRIGFVDNRLENYHANVFLKAFRGQLKDRGWTVAGCWSRDADDGRAWAAHNDVPWYGSPAALNEQVDAFMVLAPSNPELHLELCEQVFPFAKPTYVDKTFAPDIATARKIFDLADHHKTPVQTTSALRYTNVQDHVKSAGGAGAVKHMITWGGGSSFAEYAIHPVELLISCMGAKATSLMRRGGGEYSQLLINFDGNRTGVANVFTHGDNAFAAGVTTEKGDETPHVETSKDLRSTTQRRCWNSLSRKNRTSTAPRR
jgi:predicted dehydrogenase